MNNYFPNNLFDKKLIFFEIKDILFAVKMHYFQHKYALGIMWL